MIVKSRLNMYTSTCISGIQIETLPPVCMVYPRHAGDIEVG